MEGRPVYRKGFGLASMELPLSLSPSLRMRIGSSTKHFAALAYLLLCEEGKAEIDDPVGKHLPELHSVTHKATMRQLMGNTSGLRDVHDICWQFSGTGRPATAADLLSIYRDIDDNNAIPGSAWIYNNGGWLILSAAIERISGQSLEQVLRERIFDPIGMNDTLLRRFDTDFVPNSATLHMTGPSGKYEKSYLGQAMVGEGGMASTVDDMLRWLGHMRRPTVGVARTWEAMKAPQNLNNGTSTGYSLGLMIGKYRGVDIIHHGGGVNGGGAQMLQVPAAGLDVVVLVNRHDASAVLLTNRILDVCLFDLASAKGASNLPIATGLFRSPVTGRVVHLHRGDQLPLFAPLVKGEQQIVSIDGLDLPFEADADGVLRPIEELDYIKINVRLIGDRHAPSSIRLSDFGNVDDCVAIKPTPEAEAGIITGQYRSDTTCTQVTIGAAEAGPKMSTTGRFGSAELTLKPLAAGIWRAQPRLVTTPGGILSFDSSGNFRFSSARNRSLLFNRCR